MADIASRDHYLTLALFSRRIIKALVDFVRDGKRKRLDTALPAAIQSLQAATGNRRPSGYGLRVMRRYDQVRTINELFPKREDRTKMIRTLKSLEKKGDEAVQKERATEAIYFFYAIENRALRNYRHPSRPSLAASIK